MRISKNIFLLLLIIVAIPGSYFYFSEMGRRYNSIESFQDCVDSGIMVTATYPEKCILPGKTFVNNKQENNKFKESEAEKHQTTSTQLNKDFHNLSYNVNGRLVQFNEGAATSLSNNELRGTPTRLEIRADPFYFDVNDDKIVDAVFLIKEEDVYQKEANYYLAVAIALNEGFAGLNAVYIGRTITTTTLAYNNGTINLVYYETSSSTKRQKKFVVKGNILRELSN